MNTISETALKKKVTQTVTSFHGHKLEKIGDFTFRTLRYKILDTVATKWLYENGYIRVQLDPMFNKTYFVISLTPHGLSIIEQVDGFSDPLKKKKRKKNG